MAPLPAPLRRGLVLWIVAMLATSGLVVASRQSDPETTLVASGTPDAADERPAVTTTTAAPVTTTAAPAPTAPPTTAPVPTPTTAAAPTTTVPPAPTTTVPVPTFSISPNQPLSASPGYPDHFMLAGADCPGARVMLRVHGGQFDNEFYDVPSTLPDGTWGIGMMVAIPGTYEMRAACQDAGGATLFDYAPITFTILP